MKLVWQQRCRLHSVVFTTALIALASPPLCADSLPSWRQVYVKAQPLAQALKTVATRFDQAFVLNATRVEKLDAPALKGRYTLDEALTVLLQNTGLSYQVTPNGIVISRPAEQSEKTVMEEVAVNGIRASLNVSRRQKRESAAISDVIAARDMASYPDRNLAESLQRIPGMSITREAGEGRQIVLRGLNPDFTLVTLNGMPVLSNNDSPMDSRLQKHRDRSFDLNLFASDLFNEIQVLKSYSVEQPSGGLAGIAALKTAHPFDTPGLRWTVTQQAGINQYSDDTARRVSGMVSSTRGSWGALFSASYGVRDSQETGANTFRWRQLPPDGADISALPLPLQEAWQAQQIWVPRGNRYSLWRSDMERIGIGASIEYLTSNEHITFDYLFGQLSGDRRENHLYPRGYNSTPVIAGKTRIEDAQINHRDELIYARYRHARVGTESRFQTVSNRYQQWVINTEHQFSTELSGVGTFGIEHATYDMPRSVKAYMRGISDVTIDYRQNYHFVDTHYTGSLVTPDFWHMNELDSERYSATSEFINARYRLDYTPDAQHTLQVGTELTRFKNSIDYTDVQNILLTEWQHNSVANQVPVNLTYVLANHPKQHWLALDPVATFDFFDVPVNPDALAYSRFTTPSQRNTEQNRIQEYRAAGFVQHHWQRHRWQIISGLRLEYDRSAIEQHGETLSSNRLQHINWLPAVSVNYRLNDQILRASFSRTVGRPQLETLANTARYDPQNATLTRFNPALKPYSAYNVDISAEAYPGDTNRFAVTLFAKWLDDYIVSTSSTMAINALPEQEQSLIAATHVGNTVHTVMASNAEQSMLYGIEGSTQIETTLAGLFPALQTYHLGMVANLSYTQGNIRYFNDNTGAPIGTKTLPFLSPWLANITAYVEGYALSIRLSATYRDRYIARVDSNTLQDEDETGFEQSLYLDAVLAYQFSDNWEVRLEATNLSNEQEMQYSDASRRPYNTTVSGRNYYLGLTYRF
ncbi:TonB-dependent receptor [Alteromonas gilva]|uniref:TonB-dependent receptor n=1 Tax=Alteromonas gilva TaxID=2987522 RepID=A0ABT5L189_9ALTE|nr:TonB-dependent receptor [Alteromonas gilva]MDC8830810.1 TonB-dependent receptor [Alteromonas gilva]